MRFQEVHKKIMLLTNKQITSILGTKYLFQKSLFAQQGSS
jgi:hypothetical protein